MGIVLQFHRHRRYWTQWITNLSAGEFNNLEHTIVLPLRAQDLSKSIFTPLF